MMAALLRQHRLARLEQFSPADRQYYRTIYAAQGPKAILLEAGRNTILGQALGALAVPDFVDPSVAELKRQARLGAIRESPLVPTVLPLQIVRIGGRRHDRTPRPAQVPPDELAKRSDLPVP